MTTAVEFLLIGGGLAAATAAATLRDEGAQGTITLLAGEEALPYHRPPLSKDYLLKNTRRDRVLIHSQAYYSDHAIDVRLGARAVRLDTHGQLVETDRAGIFHYQKLLIATGMRACRLHVSHDRLAGIHYLRSIQDAEQLRDGMAVAKHAVIVGASFIAMELAAACATRGIETTLIAKEQQLYDRLQSPEVSAFFTDYYQTRGIRIVFGETIKAFSGREKVTAAVTETGKTFPCDLVAIGVGAEPELDFLDDCELRVNDGVVVNQYLEASASNVYAAGDIARFFDPVFKRSRRIEHWDNAVKQGKIAARNMLGKRESYRAVSYFFSDVFDLSFDFVGDIHGTDRRVVRRIGQDSSFSVLYLKEDHLRAGFLLKRPVADGQAAGSLILNRIPLSRTSATLSDPSVPLNAWSKQTVLILQGGGALGAFECGVVKALDERAIFPDVVAGVSIGAFNAAIVAGNPRQASRALEAFWRELSIDTPAAPTEAARRTLSSWYSLAFGIPNFFRPRWFTPFLTLEQLPFFWTSFYDPSPIKDLLRKYINFKQLKDSPVRLLVNAVNVETAELETFDSYIDEISPDHLLASGSLPPGFPWTTLHGKHYWDGGIVSNSPLDQVIDHCGLTNKEVYIVNLYPARKRLPRDLPETLARRDEIVYAERTRSDLRTREMIENYKKLVEEIMSRLDPAVAEHVKQRPLYIETIGQSGPLSITRIVHDEEKGEGPSKDYEFSTKTVEQHIQGGYKAACRVLDGLVKSAPASDRG
ncbi:MAG: FAD-dependent oxidoreductase [Methylococcaceae bacterium]|nr:FAD-dependent oxidoreductase [Methylococcaceae bacterium]